MNKNHKIDRLLVEPSKNMIILIDNKVSHLHDTVAHIYRYNHINTSNDDTTDDFDLDIQRSQMISTSYDLMNGTVFLYNGNSEEHLFLVFCEGNALHSMSLQRCEYFLWKRDAIDDTNVFHRIENFELLDGIPLNEYNDIHSPAKTEILTSNNVLAFQFDDNVVVVDDKTNPYPPNGIQKQQIFSIPCSTDKLLDIFVVKTKTSDAKKFNLNLQCVHVCSNSNDCDGITFTVTIYPLFEEQIHMERRPATSQSFVNVHGSKEKINQELHRIESILSDLKSHLVSHQEEYLRRIQSKTNSFKKILNIVSMMQSGMPMTDELVANKIRFNNNNNTVDTIVLNDDKNINKNISTLYKEMKLINEDVLSKLPSKKQVKKRSLQTDKHWSGRFLHVKKLYLNGNHQFKGNIFDIHKKKYPLQT